MVFQINLCSPLYDHTQDGEVNLRVTRILFAVELLLLCIAYNIISFFLKKDINSMRLEDKQSNQTKLQLSEIAYKKWQNQYLLAFGDHVVSIGFVMTFSPYGFELALAACFLLLRIAYEIRLHKWQKQTKPLKTTFRILNMSLLLCAMVGLSRTSFSTPGNCNDSSYQLV